MQPIYLAAFFSSTSSVARRRFASTLCFALSKASKISLPTHPTHGGGKRRLGIVGNIVALTLFLSSEGAVTITDYIAIFVLIALALWVAVRILPRDKL